MSATPSDPDTTSKSFTCEGCGLTFSGKNAAQRYASHCRHCEEYRALKSEVEETGEVPVESMLASMKRILPFEIPDASTEEESDRDGILSYAVEFHALLIGIGLGAALVHDFEFWFQPVLIVFAAAFFGVEFVEALNAVRSVPINVPEKYLNQIRIEIHYFVGGLMIGALWLSILHGAQNVPEWASPLGDLLGWHDPH